VRLEPEIHRKACEKRDHEQDRTCNGVMEPFQYALTLMSILTIFYPDGSKGVLQKLGEFITELNTYLTRRLEKLKKGFEGR
jgi:hypothetical protein